MKSIVLAGALAMCASSAMAATVSFSLGGPTDNNESSFVYSQGGVDLTVSGIRCGNSAGPNSASCNAALIDRYDGGIGMDGGGNDSHQVDGSGSNEFLKLAFNPSITLKSASFTYVSNLDTFRLYTHNGTDWDYEGDANPCNQLFCVNPSTTYTYNFAGTYFGSMFLIGATGSNDDFKLKAVSVDYEVAAVPLPAAGWMLVAGLGGIAALKRRRKAA